MILFENDPVPNTDKALVRDGALHLERPAPYARNNGLNSYSFDQPVIVRKTDLESIRADNGTFRVCFLDKDVVCMDYSIDRYDGRYACYPTGLVEVHPY